MYSKLTSNYSDLLIQVEKHFGRWAKQPVHFNLTMRVHYPILLNVHRNRPCHAPFQNMRRILSSRSTRKYGRSGFTFVTFSTEKRPRSTGKWGPCKLLNSTRFMCLTLVRGFCHFHIEIFRMCGDQRRLDSLQRWIGDHITITATCMTALVPLWEA